MGLNVKKYLLIFLFILYSFPLESGVIRKISDAPDPFSPNNDGTNDSLQINFKSAKKWSEWTIVIKNTNEEIKRSYTGLITNGDMNVSVLWDGKDGEGNLLADGTYDYNIDLYWDNKPPVTELVSSTGFYIIEDKYYGALSAMYSFEATDYGRPLSGVKRIRYKKQSGNNWKTYQYPINFSNKGN